MGGGGGGGGGGYAFTFTFGDEELAFALTLGIIRD